MPRYDVPKAAPRPLRLVQQFVNTVDAEHEQEWITTPDDLGAWFREHSLPAEEPITQSELRRAIDVREALRELAHANNGAPLSAEAVSTLNHGFRAARIEFEVDASGRVVPTTTARGLDKAIGILLGTVVEAVYDGTWPRLKACRQCRWLFYDYSSNRSARWCSMLICGNRAKTRAYRGRRRSDAPGGRA